MEKKNMSTKAPENSVNSGGIGDVFTHANLSVAIVLRARAICQQTRVQQ